MNWVTFALTATMLFGLLVPTGWSRSDIHSRLNRSAASSKARFSEPGSSTLSETAREAARTSPSVRHTRGRYNAPAPDQPAAPQDPQEAKAKKPGFFARAFGRKKAPEPPQPTQPTRHMVTPPNVPAPIIHTHVLAKSTKANTSLVVDVSKQKAYLLVNGEIAITTPVSTARAGKYTPRGTFRIGERVRSGKVSTIYGVGMPYWMRLGGSLYGVHAGYLPGYPASAGCIRLPIDAAQSIFDHTRSGTQVRIYSSWGRS